MNAAVSSDPSRAEVASVLPGGMGAVGGIYDAHHAALFDYAASLTRDDGAAEEIVQEAFTRLVVHERGGRMPDDARAWLYTVCLRIAIGRSRRRSIVRRWLHLVTVRPDEAVDEAAEEAAVRRERHGQLHEALGTLPVEQRAALLLAAEGFAGREIAQALGRSEGATRNILWRSRLALRARLAEREVLR